MPLIIEIIIVYDNIRKTNRNSRRIKLNLKSKTKSSFLIFASITFSFHFLVKI